MFAQFSFRAVLSAAMFFSLHGAMRAENEVGFIERFALAADRAKVLGELVPGTEDFFFYHALHFQNTRDEKRLEETLAEWVKQMPDENDRRRVILNREALLDYGKDPKGTIEYLKARMGVEWNHERETPEAPPDLPERLDAALIARDVFEQKALTDDAGLETLSQVALARLVAQPEKLKPEQRKALLQRISRPDVKGLVELIIADLAATNGGDFGNAPIHRLLLPEQLDALEKKFPTLKALAVFVHLRLEKLTPHFDENIEYDSKVREAWLDRLWAYAETLPQAFDSIKAAVLWRRLEHDRTLGVYDVRRLLAFIQRPRRAEYANAEWLSGLEGRGALVEDSFLDEPCIRRRPEKPDVDALVRECFLTILAKEGAENPNGEPWRKYTEWVSEAWLKPLFAEAMLTHGIGDPAKWAGLLSEDVFQRLRERVDIEFPATNALFIKPGDDVTFDVIVKNTPKLLVRVFELNALNFYLHYERELDTNIDLAGLVATSEGTEDVEVGPFLRKRKTFTFPGLKNKRGAWLVELIGGGRSSRALIRVGQWQVISKTGAAGLMLSVFDERREPVPDAVAWLEGRKFTRDPQTGLLIIPFTTKPDVKSVVLSDAAGTVANRMELEHPEENYALSVGFHIEREQLLSRQKATIAVRPSLYLGDMLLDPAMLENPRLTLHFVSHDSIASRVEFTDLKLRADAVSTFDFQVPEGLASITAILSGKLGVLSLGGEKRELSDKLTWKLNQNAPKDIVAAGLLSRSEDGYFYELKGRNGEAIPGRTVQLEFSHRNYGPSVKVSLRTDVKGRIALGGLADIDLLHATGDGIGEGRWKLRGYECSRPEYISAREGDEVRVPLPPGTWPPEMSLLEMRGLSFVVAQSAKMDVEDGSLVIRDLRAGSYSLAFRDSDDVIEIHVTRAVKAGNWLLGETQFRESLHTAPLQISDIALEKDHVTVKLANVNPFTRVHIAATRFVPSWRLNDTLIGLHPSRPATRGAWRGANIFSRNREIGDEYRYILERRAQKVYAGNMLARPGLILNPWRTDDLATEAMTQRVAEQESVGESGMSKGFSSNAFMTQAPITTYGASVNLDFLTEPAPVLYNLVPDKDGVVRIDRKALGDRYFVQVYAEDLSSAVQRNVALSERPTKLSDRRLAKTLEPNRAFSERREVTALAKGESLVVPDIVTSELETYDTLSRVHALLGTLNPDAPLADFAWLLEWPDLKDGDRLAKYSKHACHEVNFFLSRKDPAFFEKVIRPYLANKKERTFMDDYLLGHDLAAYLEPRAYARLNAVECALLGARIVGEGANAFRRLREQWELIVPDPAADEALFETALRGRALAGSAAGLQGELDGLRDELAMEANDALPMPPGYIPGLGPDDVLKQRNTARGLQSRKEARTRGVAERESLEELRRYALQPGNRMNEFGAVASDQEMADKIVELQKKQDSDPEAKATLEDLRSVPNSRNWFALAAATDALGQNVQWGAGFEGKVAESAFTGAAFGRALRENVRSFYRSMGSTREFAEHNYYRRRIAEQDATLVPVNAFWRDFAKHIADGNRGAFVSPRIAECSRNVTEMMLALAVLDLPFTAEKHATKAEGAKFTLTASGPIIVFHRQIAPVQVAKVERESLLVAQNFYRHDDRFVQDGNEKIEKHVTGEFLTGVVYGANVVVTNPSATPRKADVLVQIPEGAIPVLGAKATFSRKVRLNAFSAERFEYAFYFPALPGKGGGRFAHYPVNAWAGGSGGAAKPATFKVVARPTVFDRDSWEFISQRGTSADVFAFLAKKNIAALDFSRVAWRCKDAAFYKKLTAFMVANQAQDETIASYGLLHNDARAVREWLKMDDAFLDGCGPWLSSDLLVIEPIARRSYEHLEYAPLINQRAHKLGAEWRISNPVILEQYTAFLEILAHKPALDATDVMGVTYYLLLQDRVEEALERFRSVNADELAVKIQYDYFACYAGLYESRLDEVRAIASKYAGYPVGRWRALFGEIIATLDEVSGKAVATTPAGVKGREPLHDALASGEAAFDLKIENAAVHLTYRNLETVTVNYYLIDPEFAFSSAPFSDADPARAGVIKPKLSVPVALPKGARSHEIPIPAELRNADLLVEVAGAGIRKTVAHHSHSMKLAITENYGRLEVRRKAGGESLSGAYVKVYARLRGGSVRFYKDGYTDRRGRFDYASINTGEGRPAPLPIAKAAGKQTLDHQTLKPGELGNVEVLRILVLSKDDGAVVREVHPPSQ